MKALRKIIIILQKIAHRVKQCPSKLVHSIYSTRLIKLRVDLSRKRAIEDHSTNLSKITSEDMLIANILKDKGYFVSEANSYEYFSSEEFKGACGDIFKSIEGHYIQTGEKIDIIKLISTKPFLITQFETIFRAGLDIKLLKIIEHYLQLPVAYGGVDIFYTIADGLEKGARTWHKDSEDYPMIKVALYVNEVGDEDGPLEILHLHHTSSKFEKLKGFNLQKLISFQSAGQIKFEVTSFTGLAESLIICDTSRYFHRGKPATRSNRKALFFNYYANRPLTPYFCPNPPFSIGRMRYLVSNLSREQKNAALWREDLTGIDRLVTKRKPYLNLSTP